jgi:hypothetical protein
VDIDLIESNERGFLNPERAQLIYELNGVVKPLVVREIGPNRYRIVAGINTLRDVQYIQQEIDDDFEMVKCYVAKTDEEEDKLVALYEMS